MNLQNTNEALKLVLSVGDESGIGPEIIAPVDLAVFTIFSVDLSNKI